MHDSLIWAEIDLAAIAHNVRELRRITSSHSLLMVAVKANAYGHGAVQVARTALENGADQLGVARLEEGIALRRAGVDAPILIFGLTLGSQVPELLAHHLTASVFSLEGACQLNTAVPDNQQLPVHIKVDTGMGRMGILTDDRRCRSHDANANELTANEIIGIAALEKLRIEGIWTHFASSDESDKTIARQQLQSFNRLREQLARRNMAVPCSHAANSGAIIDMPESHLDMVRAGISVYGLYPSQAVNQRRIKLRPAMALKALISHLKQIPAGTRISYGGTWTASQATTIATVPIGYGDGFSRQLSNRGQMLVHGRRAPIVGRVCMDLTMLDVGHIPNVRIADEVVILGRQGDAGLISADEIADLLGTINYEVVTTVMARVQRIFSE